MNLEQAKEQMRVRLKKKNRSSLWERFLKGRQDRQESFRRMWKFRFISSPELKEKVRSLLRRLINELKKDYSDFDSYCKTRGG